MSEIKAAIRSSIKDGKPVLFTAETAHRDGYDLNLMSSEGTLPESGYHSVFIQNTANDGYIIRIFDQSDDYTDYKNLSGEISEAIAAKFDGTSELNDRGFCDYLTSNLGHTPSESRAHILSARTCRRHLCPLLLGILDWRARRHRYSPQSIFSPHLSQSWFF